MTQYDVTGMSCAACSARVEKAVTSVQGVSSCAVNLLTNSMTVEGSATPADVIKAVIAAGYGASLKEDRRSADSDQELKDTTTPRLLARLLVSLVFLLPLMYLSMGYTMWGWWVPSFLEDIIPLAVAQMVLALIIMGINGRFFINGVKGVIHRAPNMDTLVALGSGASFLYSVYGLAVLIGSNASISSIPHFYFESAAMILVLITVGKVLESYSKGRTTDAIKGLMSLTPTVATVIDGDEERAVPVEQVSVGDIFVVKAGDSIPVDGVIIDGAGVVDESALTGESVPVDKVVGDSVASATINQSGYMRCRATAVGEDTTLSRIVKMVSDAAASKAPIAKIADKVSGIFVPVVLGIALVVFIVWMIVGEELGFALNRAISVLVISCPCALGLATPVAIMVGNGVAAKNGVLFKTATALEHTGKAQIVALDKTGTITLGKPTVTDIIPAQGVSDSHMLSLAYSVEKLSEHPLARAIVTEAESRDIELKATTDYATVVGKGVSATIDGEIILAGSYDMIAGSVDIDDSVTADYQRLAHQGKTPLLFAYAGRYVGMIAVADVIKEDSPAAIKELQDMGISVVMITGDNQRTADAIGQQAGVDYVVSGVLPEGKASVVTRLQKFGVVAMVGDGINDAPALTTADIGIAIDAGTDIAIDSADVVLMNSRLTDVVTAIKLSRSTLTNIKENLFWAFIYNLIGIPLAAGVWIPIFGWTLNPMFGAAAMSLSSFCVVTNALRLNLFRPDKSMRISSNKQVKIDIKEAITMTKVVKIEGMMCPHCEATMQKAFLALPQVDAAVASHDTNSATLTLNAELDDATIQQTVESAGYKYIG